MRVLTCYFKNHGRAPVLGVQDAGIVVWLPRGGTAFLRIADTDAKNLEDALDRARPQKGETVLNTVPAPCLRSKP